MAQNSTTEPTTHRPSVTAAERDVPRDDGAAETTVPRIEPEAPEPQARTARLHELLLEARVAALEQRLEYKERQIEEIRSQYEAVLSRRTGADSADGDSGIPWLPWD